MTTNDMIFYNIQIIWASIAALGERRSLYRTGIAISQYSARLHLQG